MKKLMLLLLAALLLCGCAGEENDREAVYVNISAQEAKAIMDSESGYVILDVRTQEEYDSVLSWMYLNDLEGFTQEASAADKTFIPDF